MSVRDILLSAEHRLVLYFLANKGGKTKEKVAKK